MEIFQKTADQIRRISTEQEFLASLMSHEAQYDDSGNFTEHGLATLGTHAIAYHSASENAARTKAEIKELEQMLDTGKLGTFHSVEQLQARLDELYAAWQTDISEASAAEQAVFDAMSAKYEAELQALTEIVEARKEALSVEKELYSYQNQISEKTKSISTLQKQIAAYRGDTSEEGQARLQKLQVSLQEAQKDLQDTEYDKYISDQQEMLDSLVREYQEAIQTRLEHFEDTVNEGFTAANQHASLILGTLQKVAGENGYNMQYSPEGQTTLAGYVSQITAGLAEIASKTAEPTPSGSDAETNTEAKPGTPNAVSSQGSRTTQNTTFAKPAVQTQSTVSSQDSRTAKNATFAEPAIQTQSTVSSQGSRTTQNGILAKMAADFIAKNATTHTKEKIEDYSDVNQVIWKDKAKLYDGTGKVLSSANLRKLAELIGVTYNGATKKGNLYKKLAELDIKGFANGSKNIPQDQMAWTQENGGEIIYRASDGAILTPLSAGDKVFSAEMSNRLWELAKATYVLPNIPDATVIHTAAPSLTQNTSIGDVQFNFDLTGCQNPTDIVKEIQNNYKIRQAIQSVTIDRMMGKPKLGVNRIK